MTKTIIFDTRTKDGLKAGIKNSIDKYSLPIGVIPIKSSLREQLFEFLLSEWEIFSDAGDFSEEYLRDVIHEVLKEQGYE